MMLTNEFSMGLNSLSVLKMWSGGFVFATHCINMTRFIMSCQCGYLIAGRFYVKLILCIVLYVIILLSS